MHTLTAGIVAEFACSAKCAEYIQVFSSQPKLFQRRSFQFLWLQLVFIFEFYFYTFHMLFSKSVTRKIKFSETEEKYLLNQINTRCHRSCNLTSSSHLFPHLLLCWHRPS